MGLDRKTVFGLFSNDGDIKIAVKGKCHCSWYGCCRHHKEVEVLTFFGKGYTLFYSKLMLFIKNDERKIGKLHIWLEKGVRSNDHEKGLVLELLENFFSRCGWCA